MDISSKLVTRITRLPYLTDPSNAEIQMIDVTTQVYPSNMGEAPVPWWVLLLAVLGGLLLLGVFVYGLYKVGTCHTWIQLAYLDMNGEFESEKIFAESREWAHRNKTVFTIYTYCPHPQIFTNSSIIYRAIQRVYNLIVKGLLQSCKLFETR